MSRYIDADAHKEVFEKLRHRGIFPNARDEIILQNYLDEFPTADVVEVVPCKDCKFYQDNNGGYPTQECKWIDGETPNSDDFCSFAERRIK